MLLREDHRQQSPCSRSTQTASYVERNLVQQARCFFSWSWMTNFVNLFEGGTGSEVIWKGQQLAKKDARRPAWSAGIFFGQLLTRLVEAAPYCVRNVPEQDLQNRPDSVVIHSLSMKTSVCPSFAPGSPFPGSLFRQESFPSLPESIED